MPVWAAVTHVVTHTAATWFGVRCSDGSVNHAVKHAPVRLGTPILHAPCSAPLIFRSIFPGANTRIEVSSC